MSASMSAWQKATLCFFVPMLSVHTLPALAPRAAAVAMDVGGVGSAPWRSRSLRGQPTDPHERGRIRMPPHALGRQACAQQRGHAIRCAQRGTRLQPVYCDERGAGEARARRGALNGSARRQRKAHAPTLSTRGTAAVASNQRAARSLDRCRCSRRSRLDGDGHMGANSVRAPSGADGARSTAVAAVVSAAAAVAVLAAVGSALVVSTCGLAHVDGCSAGRAEW